MHIDTYCSIMTACVAEGGELFVTVMNDALAEERQQHAVPLVFDSGGWSFLSNDAVLPWVAAGAARLGNEFVLVGWGGQVLAVAGTSSRREAIIRRDGEPVSIIRAVERIGDGVYAAGMRRQVYLRSSGKWMEIDAGADYRGDEIDVGFEAIAGFDSEEVYAAGFGGALWSYGKQGWKEIHSPTNLHLHSMSCAVDGKVYVGGRKGILLAGRGQSWNVEMTGLDEPIRDVHWFGGQLFLLTASGVFSYSGKGAEPIVPGELTDVGYVCLASAQGVLFVVGHKSILKYDGTNWQKLPLALKDGMESSPAFVFLNNEAALDRDEE
ncbi:hypothetical protein [Pseudoduganella sp. OTU4001]|uniref:hypothetical protein n=1 Tax=Pseudoduganella sp. OTU4001 TaxID=3043854 RepID=UPI00313B4284